MIEKVCINDHRGTKFYTHADYPLSIGTDPDANLEVSIRQMDSTVTQTPAFLIIIVNHAYIDTTNSAITIRLNNETIHGQKEIQHDDILEIENSLFHCERIGNMLSISLYKDDPLLFSKNEKSIVSSGELIEPVLFPTSAREIKSKSALSRILPFLGILLFALLAVVIGYIFTSKSLLLEIEPTPDHVAIYGKIWPVKLQGRYLLQPGNYSIQVEKAGYKPLKQKIKIGTQASQTLVFSLEKKPGYLNISSQPIENVAIVLNGNMLGKTPINTLELEAGTYALEASSERYQPYTTQLIIEGKSVTQELNIELLPDWVEVIIDSKPSGAEIWLNGEHKGLTPQSLELDTGQYHLDLRHPDYMPFTKDFSVDASQLFELPVAELFTKPSRIIVTSTPTSANVSIAGKKQGVTPFTQNVNPNTKVNITLSKPGYKSNQKTVNLKPGEEQKVSTVLEPVLGTIVLNVSPEDSEIFINGNYIDKGSVKLTLPSTRQRLEIKKLGYKSYEKMLSPDPNTPQVLDIKLLRLSGTINSGQANTIRTSQEQILKLIYGGKFSMGSPRREQGRRSNETLHTVELIRPFYISTHEVSNQQFSAFRNTHSSGAYKGHDLAAPNLPVSNISWEDAAKYCNWLSDKDGLEKVYREEKGTLVAKIPIPAGYRLPTESEWEWVARSQKNKHLSRYEWGDNFPPNKVTGNYADESAKQIIDQVLPDYNDGFITAAPVGSFKANFFGIYDMGGNVAEWCHDYHSIYPSLSDEIFTDPTGPTKNTAIDNNHVIRGASWMRGDLSSTRLSYRDRNNSKRKDIGFRIAKYID
jgi:formylglycine-generating enzyme required for sulfatase activity